MSVNRIGLFGGTFDPVHNGHLQSAVELTEHCRLDTLYLLPNHQPMHRNVPGASSEHRIAMLELAVAGVSHLAIDKREAVRGGPTYTIDTLTDVHLEQPNAEILFFMGVDAFAEFDTWHRWMDILEIAHLVIIDRPGSTLSPFAKDLLSGPVGPDANRGIERCTLTQLAISSTVIRERIKAGQSVQFLLPRLVREYIEHHDLYR